MNAPLATEEQIHCVIVDILRFNAHPDTIFFHAANGESRSKRTGARLKRMGVVPGVPDICLTLPDGRSAYLEIKSAKGVLSPEQRAFRARCEATGIPYAVVRSSAEAEQILHSWGALSSRKAA